MQTFSQNCHKTLHSIFNLEQPADEISDINITISDTYTPQNELIVHIPFYGSISGDFLLSVNEAEWQQSLKDSISSHENNLVNSSLKEFLNIAVGQTIPFITKDFTNLNYSSPRIIRGQLEYPNSEIISSTINHQGLPSLEIAIAIDLMKTNISEKIFDLTLEKIKSTSSKSLYNKLYKLLPLILEKTNTQILCYEITLKFP